MIINLKDCKQLKIIRNDNNKCISIIEFNNKKYILKQATSYDVNIINMLKNEVNVLYILQNTNYVPSLINYNFDENGNYIVTELIKGKRINDVKKLDFKSKILLMIEIIDILINMHTKGVIHCDLKPSNIILGLDKKVRIIDYGISIYDDKKYFANYGSISYCSVQQVMRKEIDYNTDLYSVGIILYEMLLGKLPFNGKKEEVMNKKIQCNFEICNDDLLNYIFCKLFYVNNPSRYINLSELKNDLYLLLKIKYYNKN